MQNSNLYAFVLHRFLEIRLRALYGIPRIQTNIANHMRLGRTNVRGFASLHLGKCHRGTQKGVQVPAAFFSKHIQNGRKQPTVSKYHAIEKG